MMRYHFGTAVVVAAISVAAAKEALRPPQIEPVERADYNRLHSRERCFQQHPYGIIAAIESRKQLPSLLNALGLFGYGVEIGVFQGLFSKHVLSEWRGRKLFLVDPWESQDPLAYADKANMPQAKMDRNLNLVGATLSRLGSASAVPPYICNRAFTDVPVLSIDRDVCLVCRHWRA